MDINEIWNKALKETEIVRSRVMGLSTFTDTSVSYIFLSESAVNKGDTVVRQGDVIVEKPSLIMPFQNPQLKGFDFDHDYEFSEDSLVNFFLVRGIRLPSWKYNHKTRNLDVFEGRLSKAVTFHMDKLQREENVKTGLIIGPEDCWQMSLLIFVCSQISRSAPNDIQKLFERRND